MFEQQGTIDPNPPGIIGEVEAGRASKVRKEIKKLILAASTSAFDLAELLFEAKSNNYYREWGFQTFPQYAESLAVGDMKTSKCYYLVRMVETMTACDIPRSTYEPVGRTKIRVITKLKPEVEYQGTPGKQAIKELVAKAGQLSYEELNEAVDELLGAVGDDAMCWLNIHVKKLSRENVIKPAIERARKHIGSVATDENTGEALDASEGAALEVICANFLADPNFAEPEIPDAPTPPQTDEDESTLDTGDAIAINTADAAPSPVLEAALNGDLDDELAKVNAEIAALENDG